MPDRATALGNFIIYGIATVLFAPFVLMGAYAIGMAYSQLRHWAPDQYMHYRLAFDVEQLGSLVFEGKTLCVHEAHVHGEIFHTKNTRAPLRALGRDWLLDGISCDALHRDHFKPQYTLYEIAGADLARVRYVAEFGAARITRAEFRWGEKQDWPASWRSTPVSKRPGNVRYAAGPFAYQKLRLSERLSFLPQSGEPVRIHSTHASCNGQPTTQPDDKGPTLALDMPQWRSVLQAVRLASVVEKGYLRFVATDQTWIMDASITGKMPLDAVQLPGWEDADPSNWRACLNLKVSGETYALGALPSAGLVYFPEDMAVLQVAMFRERLFGHYKDGANPGRLWLLP